MLSRIIQANVVRGCRMSNNSDIIQQYRSFVSLSEEVKHAKEHNLPIVALESTIISHGMPYPQNLQVAKDVEAKVREFGAIPATIAIIDGVCKVGLNQNDLERIANTAASNTKIIKASRRDLSYAMANNLCAGTTVASTMILAHSAGINVFATGGIGGVHRGAEVTMDISADLIELGKTPVCVVCAGVKSILDISKTLEVLETQGVPVLGYQTDTFPAFFTRSSGIKTPMRVESAEEIARMMIWQYDMLKMQTGMILGVPNPNPAMDDASMEAIIAAALQDAAVKHISGAAITPFLLSAIEKATVGKSLASNIDLVLNNASVAAMIAKQYTELKILGANSSNAIRKPSFTKTVSSVPSRNDEHPVLVFGGAVVDTIARATVPVVINSSVPGVAHSSFGGVARNLAEGLARQLRNSGTVSLVSAVADDEAGMGLLRHAQTCGIDVSRTVIVRRDGSEVEFKEFQSETADVSSLTGRKFSTATYTAIHDAIGDLQCGIADMQILSTLRAPAIKRLAGLIRTSRLVVVDGNLHPEAFAEIANICSSTGVPLFFEPTSEFKCTLPVELGLLGKVDVVKPNVWELVAMVATCHEKNLIHKNKIPVKSALAAATAAKVAFSGGDINAVPAIADVRTLAVALQNVMMSNASEDRTGQNRVSRLITSEGLPRKIQGKHVLVSLGSRGVLWCGVRDAVQLRRAGADDSLLKSVVVVDDWTAVKHFPAVDVDPATIVNSSGAGDALCAGIIGEMLGTGCTQLDSRCIEVGLQAAARALVNTSSVAL